MTTPSTDYRLIPLTQGQSAIVDSADYGWLAQWKWHAAKIHGGFYATRQSARQSQRMHRLIMGDPAGMHVDHINGNTLDNRRENLRSVTHAQNLMNQKLSRANKSGFKGVSMDRSSGKWRAHITKDGIVRQLGYFPTPELAHEAYCTAAAIVHGEFARVR